MKKMLLTLSVILVLALVCFCPAGAEEPAKRDLTLQLVLSERQVRAGDTIQVYFSAANTSGKDFTSPVTLMDPKGKQVKGFGAPVLKSGTYAYWFGSWTVTEKDLEAEKIIFTVKYSVEDENGGIVNKKVNVSRGISASLFWVFWYSLFMSILMT